MCNSKWRAPLFVGRCLRSRRPTSCRSTNYPPPAILGYRELNQGIVSTGGHVDTLKARKSPLFRTITVQHRSLIYNSRTIILFLLSTSHSFISYKPTNPYSLCSSEASTTLPSSCSSQPPSWSPPPLCPSSTPKPPLLNCPTFLRFDLQSLVLYVIVTIG